MHRSFPSSVIFDAFVSMLQRKNTFICLILKLYYLLFCPYFNRSKNKLLGGSVLHTEEMPKNSLFGITKKYLN